MAKRGIEPTDSESQLKAIEDQGKRLMESYRSGMKQKLEEWNKDCKVEGELMTIYRSRMDNTRDAVEEGKQALEPVLNNLEYLQQSFGTKRFVVENFTFNNMFFLNRNWANTESCTH